MTQLILGIEPNGYPITQNRLKDMQDYYLSIGKAFAKSLGDVVIEGAEVSGTNVTDGLIAFRGEILPFKGGVKTDYIQITEEIEKLSFSDGVQRNALKKRYVECAAAGAPFPKYLFLNIWGLRYSVTSDKDIMLCMRVYGKSVDFTLNIVDPLEKGLYNVGIPNHLKGYLVNSRTLYMENNQQKAKVTISSSGISIEVLTDEALTGGSIQSNWIYL